MRLNQFLAKNLGLSRREADGYIEKGFVKVNGKKGEFHNKVDENDTIEVLYNKKWEIATNSPKTRTIIFYKPIFSITSRNDELDRKTIYKHIPKKYHDLKPAGRLDYMSEGLLVLSNNGNLLQELTHPKFEHEKTYLVAVKTPFEKNEIEKIEKGLFLEDEKYKLNSVKIKKIKDLDKYKYLKLQKHYNWYTFVLSEGRNNQIRKMCFQFDKKVLRLVRIQQGEYKISEKLYKQKLLEI